MVKQNVQVSFIELVKTTTDEHHEERVMGETFPYYPPYKEGETLFIRSTQKGEIDPLIPLTHYIIIEVHHSLHANKKGNERFAETVTTASMDVYIRKVD